ncbi:phosphatase PAP2 family protein [Luteimonas fraxinea]|uniref:phosphatase PAP2 family protein n=1 Tax=Luteimonas fraxinea TaxID=2901869 RepID=UPI001E5DDFA4|nr:phosphatase PAP2 family protein [Luteimonas fraxinea]MCD9124795.1 phosphatase PAP2 family protein [Luteimonas fraxinea]
MNWSRITHLGDAALVLPLLVAAIVGLAIQRPTQRRAAFQWALIITTSLALVAANKIASCGWGTGIRRWNRTCFSGHTVSAWLAWPALLMLMAPTRLHALSMTLLIAGTATALLGWSRVPLGAHPLSEVIARTVLGGVAACLCMRVLCPHALDRRGISLLTAVLLVFGVAQRHRPSSHEALVRSGRCHAFRHGSRGAAASLVNRPIMNF